jgi:hypothetical protein
MRERLGLTARSRRRRRGGRLPRAGRRRAPPPGGSSAPRPAAGPGKSREPRASAAARAEIVARAAGVPCPRRPPGRGTWRAWRRARGRRHRRRSAAAPAPAPARATASPTTWPWPSLSLEAEAGGAAAGSPWRGGRCGSRRRTCTGQFQIEAVSWSRAAALPSLLFLRPRPPQLLVFTFMQLCPWRK